MQSLLLFINEGLEGASGGQHRFIQFFAVFVVGGFNYIELVSRAQQGCMSSLYLFADLISVSLWERSLIGPLSDVCL